MGKFSFKQLQSKLTRKATLGSFGGGVASNFIPPVFQPAAMVATGLLSDSDALVEVGAYAAGRQTGALVLGMIPGGSNVAIGSGGDLL